MRGGCGGELRDWPSVTCTMPSRLVRIAFMACMAAMIAHSTILTDKEELDKVENITYNTVKKYMNL